VLKKNRLFTPGPTPLLPAAQNAMAAFSLHHRTADFRTLFSRVLSDMKEFIGTTNDVLILTSSGTGAMEGAVSNLTSPGDKVLVLSAGKFGERWRDLAKAFGCTVELVSVPYGQTFAIDEIKSKLTPDIRAVYVQATESSTGVRHDIEAIASVVRAQPDTLLIVDAITGLGTTHFDVDGWGIDVIIGGSQKALMIPPGLAYCAISNRAWKRMETAKSPRYYFDFRKERKSAAKGESAFTPATSMFAALGAALDFVRQMGNGDLIAGRKVLIDNAELAARMTQAGAKSLGLELFAPTSPAAALTAIKSPEGVDSGAMVKAFRDEFGAVVANGQGEMKGQLFRIAHLGYFDYLDTIAVLAALEQVLPQVTGKPIEFGIAVQAAQKIYAETRSRAALGAAK
jgi:aspartate aminotransferase-like enzyme